MKNILRHQRVTIPLKFESEKASHTKSNKDWQREGVVNPDLRIDYNVFKKTTDEKKILKTLKRKVNTIYNQEFLQNAIITYTELKGLPIVYLGNL